MISTCPYSDRSSGVRFDFIQIILLLGFLGWPAFHQSTVHSSPLLYDIDKDGVREIALATYNGEVLFFR
jgi:hypothetical protein